MIAFAHDAAQLVLGKVCVSPHGTIGNHHTFRESCRSAGVVNQCQLFWILLYIVVDMFWSEVLRILFTEHLVKMFSGVCQLLCSRNEQRIIGNIDDSFQVWHLFFVDDGCYNVANEQQFCLAVIDNVVYLFGSKLVQNGNGNGSISQCC